ncbi:hypothetical protein TWF281_011914 [Arthrobotrys megalospora]
MQEEEEELRRITFFQVRVKIDGVDSGIREANLKLRLCGRIHHPQTFKIFWSTDRFGDMSHRSATPSSAMKHHKHYLPHRPPVRPRYAYGIEIEKGILFPGTTANSKDGFTIVAKRRDFAAFRQETSGNLYQGRWETRIDTWVQTAEFSHEWIDIPPLDPDKVDGYITLEFSERYNCRKSSWEEKWGKLYAGRICIHNDWRDFWWEGFSGINVPTSRLARNPSALASTTTLSTSHFSAYPRPKHFPKPEIRAIQAPQQHGNAEGGIVPRDDNSGPTDGSRTLVPDTSDVYVPNAKELLEEASDVFIRARMLELSEMEDDLWSYIA